MTPTIHIRAVRWDDYAQCRALCDEVFCESELPHFAAAWRNRNENASLIATLCGAAVGCAIVSKQNTIEYIAVHPEFQCYGIGSHFLRQICSALKDARSIILKTADDITLPEWYSRFGFEESHIYSDDDGEFLGMCMIRRQNCRSAARNASRVQKSTYHA